MRTVWDLIYDWKAKEAEAQRAEQEARQARRIADELRERFRDALIQHGPIKTGGVLYLAPGQPGDPIHALPIKDAMEIGLETA
jgi:hypothetical protein